MNLQHINVKIFVDGELTVDPERFIELFHRWVATQAMAEMLIDVADYRHVPNGPSVVLVGHEADYVLDNTGGRYGLVYNRKAPLDGNDGPLLTLCGYYSIPSFEVLGHPSTHLEAAHERPAW